MVPDDRALAKRLAVEGTQYDVLDSVLRHENPGEWRVVVPVSLRDSLLKEGDFQDILHGEKCIIHCRKSIGGRECAEKLSGFAGRVWSV